MTIPQISVQLYSVYQQSEADLHETLGRLADIGLPNVEAFDFVRRVDALKTAFAQHGLEAPTANAVLIEDDVATPDGLLTVRPPQEAFAATAIDSAVIEFDHYAGDIFDGIAASYNYLTSLEN